jgi:hypothetical protein
MSRLRKNIGTQFHLHGIKKYLEITFKKNVKDFYKENYKLLKKETPEGKISHAHELVE